jgi:hypothetical protein
VAIIPEDYFAFPKQEANPTSKSPAIINKNQFIFP